jgi:hypothetical protein
MNHQCGCKTEVVCHETELATICSNPIGCKFCMPEYIKTYEKFLSAFEEHILKVCIFFASTQHGRFKK